MKKKTKSVARLIRIPGSLFTICGSVLAAFLSLVFLFSGTAQAGWVKGQSKNAWWYDLGNGNYYKSSWQWVDGNHDGIAECYCFDENGWMYENTITPDRFTVNENGAWTVDNIVQTKNMNLVSQNNTNNSTGTVMNNLTETKTNNFTETKSSNDNKNRNDENFGDRQDEYREDILRKINEYREKQGKYDFLEDEDLNEYAQTRAEEINIRKSHIRPNGKLSIDGHNIKGEIITNASTPKEAFLNWKKSKGHNELMLDSDFRDFGAGCYPSKNGKYWWVIVFH